MSSSNLNRMLTRREFLGAAAVGMAGLGAAVYGFEQWAMDAPWPTADGLAPAMANSAPTPTVPLLLLANRQAQPDFSPYLAEILRAEGLVAFRNISIEQIDPSVLSAFPLAVLAAGSLNTDQAAMLRDYAAAGGALLAIRPDGRLAELFGVRYLGAVAPGDHLALVAGESAPLYRDPGPLQLHGPYDRLEVAGATVIARSAGGDPLITRYRFGQGVTALWAFDLPRAIALLRQGNPAWADQERDGMAGVRSSDMFVDWIDLERIAVPQADEHQRLFAAMLEQFAPTAPPLPRLWYFPGLAPALLVATGDAHGSRVSHINQVLDAAERYGGTMSIYYTPPATGVAGRLVRKARWAAADLPGLGGWLERDDPLPAPRHVAGWRDRGHEFGMHPYVESGLEAGYNAYWNEFLKYGYGPLPPTVRTHRILWHGWVENARVQARYGLRMNLDHYHSGGAVRKADGTWTAGYLGGTGLPMRFVAEDGTLLSVYQQPTHLVDEHLMAVFDSGHEVGLNGEAAAAVTIAQIAESVRHFPAALGLQCHVDPFLFGGEKAANVGHWLNATLDYAVANRMPVLSAENWLTFVEARSATGVNRLSWDADRRSLACELELPGSTPFAVTMLLPATHNGATLRELRVGGVVTPQTQINLAGRTYVAALIPAGRTLVQAEYAA